MDRAKGRRRRAALSVLGGAAAAAFILGAALGDSPPPRVEVAATLPTPQLAGQRIVTGFDGAKVPPELEAAIRSGSVAGVLLFSENLPSRAVGRRLIASLQAIRRPRGLRDPLLVMVDQEGGLVKRIGGAPTTSAQRMGAQGAAFSSEQGKRTAANLRNLGFNVDLAPVLDVARPGGVIAETERGFGETAQAVSASAIPFAAALQEGGVAATGKHFPGLGSAAENTDFAVQRIGLSKQALRAIDEAPYRRFVEMGGRIVMLSTAIYPAFSEKPAAFAREIATGELRTRLGFEGVSVTDALNAASVRAFGGPAKAGLAAARAGTDLLLFTGTREAERAHSALSSALRAGRLPRAAFEDSAQRVLDLREALTPARP